MEGRDLFIGVGGFMNRGADGWIVDVGFGVVGCLGKVLVTVEVTIANLVY